MSRTEADEQKAVIQWCILMEGRWPELEYIYHVPNGGSRNSREAANLKAQGVKPGVPDLELPVARTPSPRNRNAGSGPSRRWAAAQWSVMRRRRRSRPSKSTCVSGRESACGVTLGKNIRLSDKEWKNHDRRKAAENNRLEEGNRNLRVHHRGPGRFPQPTARQIQRRIPENVRG